MLHLASLRINKQTRKQTNQSACQRVSFYVRVGARGRGDMMFDIVALHAGIYRALVYAVIREEIVF